jgi:large subunit ribosomal protein L10
MPTVAIRALLPSFSGSSRSGIFFQKGGEALANKEAKAPLIDALADQLERSSIAIVTDYRGLTVSELSALRRRLSEVSVEFHVAKNTLTRFAAERVQKSAISVDLEGPTALAFGFDDPAAASKALQDYIRLNRSIMTIKGAVLGDRRLGPDEIQSLAELPPKPQLQARVVGTIQSPMSSLIGTMNGLLAQIAYVVDQRSTQLGGEAAAS